MVTPRIKNGITERIEELESENETLKAKVRTFQKLADENAEIMGMLQKDKDFMDLKMMAIENLLNNCHMDTASRDTLLKAVSLARGRV